MLYIYYLPRFQKDTIDIRALIDLDGEVNTMTLTYSLKLGLKVQSIDVKA